MMVENFENFALETRFEDLPGETIEHAKRSLIDLLGIAASGTATMLAKTITTHAVDHFGSPTSPTPILFSDQTASAAGSALATGMTIDSIDAHDGDKLTKGHIGCGLLPAILAFANMTGKTDGREILTQLVIGYEIGGRAGEALHASVPDYHTSGAWIATASAAIGARAMGLSKDKLRHAIGIAEYHGPRSQMMRVIDHPTMLKDGSGWGAMAGVSAALLAREGFTGAPAISIEGEAVSGIWSNLGVHWRIGHQYFKPYPVCRWAQPAMQAALALTKDHEIGSTDIDRVEVITFHEASRLATHTPRNTEEAQYSLPFPVAAALVHGRLTPADIGDEALGDAEVLRLSQTMTMSEKQAFNEAFPSKRIAEVILTLKTGEIISSPPTEAIGDPETPMPTPELTRKFHAFAEPILGRKRCEAIEQAVFDLEKCDDGYSKLADLLFSAP